MGAGVVLYIIVYSIILCACVCFISQYKSKTCFWNWASILPPNLPKTIYITWYLAWLWFILSRPSFPFILFFVHWVYYSFLSNNHRSKFLSYTVHCCSSSSCCSIISSGHSRVVVDIHTDKYAFAKSFCLPFFVS